MCLCVKDIVRISNRTEQIGKKCVTLSYVMHLPPYLKFAYLRPIV